MKKQTSNLLLAIAIVFTLSHCRYSSEPLYKDPKASIDQRVEDLLGRMTLDEKLAQLRGGTDTNKIGDKGVGHFGFMDKDLSAHESAIEYNKVQHYLMNKTRLGIPGIKAGEGIFAYMGNGSTSFPQSIGIASSFDTALMAKMADALGDQLKSRGIRNVLSPVVNIARDSRWGRTGETYGEDPYLTARMGVAYAKTMEQKGLITTPKHFAANMGLDGKFASSVPFTERTLREIYFPGFKACFQEAGSKSVMMAYNVIDGIPCHENKWLITDVLRKEWGFDGFVMSDGGSLDITYEGFHTDSTKKELVARTINAGCDLSDFNGKPLDEAIKDGLVSINTIDESVRRVLKQKFRIGLFENPYTDPDLAEKLRDCADHRKLSGEVADKSIVLLKNENNTLPFNKTVKSVAVVGPFGDWLLINHYGGWGRKEVTVLEGIKKLLPAANVTYEKGTDVEYFGFPAIKAEYFPNGLKAEYFDNKKLSGTAKYIKYDKDINFDWKEGSPEGLPIDGFSIRWTGKLISPVSGKYRISATFDDGARVFLNDKLIINNWENGNRRMSDTLIQLEQGKVYDFRMEYFDSGHRAYAQIGWNIDPFINIPKAVEAARKADVVIAVVGMKDDENEDRSSLELDDPQEKLIAELSKTGKPLVVVIQTGTVIAMNRWIEKVPAVLMAWYPGEEGGNAIARILFGDVNPGAKLPLCFPKVTGQVPINYNHLPYKMDDRFIGTGNDPLFSFGHGLSYTTFEYSNLKLSNQKIKADESIKITVDVKNTGNVLGDEVVQLYIHDEVCHIVRPVKELKGFKRITLKAGEHQTVTFTLGPDHLMIYDRDMKPVVELGDFKIMVGSSSDDIRQTAVLTVIK